MDSLDSTPLTSGGSTVGFGSDLGSPGDIASQSTQASWDQAAADAGLSLTAAATTQSDSWGVVGGAIGGVVGAVLGGGAGGIGGGAGGTLVAPGIGTIGGAVGGGVEGAALGGTAGAAIGYGVGNAIHGLVNWMSSSSSSGSGGADGAQKPDPSASKPYRDNPGQLENRPAAEVERELDQKLVEEGHWTKSPTKDGNGVRYLDGKGGSLIINNGYPEGLRGGGGDAVHQGPYVKIQPGGIRVPLAGNPAGS